MNCTITEVNGEAQVTCHNGCKAGWLICKHPVAERFDWDGDEWCKVCDEGTEGNPRVRYGCECQSALG